MYHYFAGARGNVICRFFPPIAFEDCARFELRDWLWPRWLRNSDAPFGRTLRTGRRVNNDLAPTSSPLSFLQFRQQARASQVCDYFGLLVGSRFGCPLPAAREKLRRGKSLGRRTLSWAFCPVLPTHRFPRLRPIRVEGVVLACSLFQVALMSDTILVQAPM
jgi:hypothetical protein